MGGGSRPSDHLRPELADEGETSFTSSSTSDYHPDDSPLSASSGITESITGSASEEESAARDNRRWCKAYFDVLRSYRNSAERAGVLRDAKDIILRHKPGDWIEEVGGTTAGDYEVPEAITLLLVGPRGSGKSTLVNRITRVFDDDLSAPDRAQVSHNLSATRGTCFLQEYMIPRKSKSLCIYDTRSLSTNLPHDFRLLQRWMTRGVSHGEMVIRDSDDLEMRKNIKSMRRQGLFSPCKRRIVNFVIFVVDGLSVLKSMDAMDDQYNEILFETFNYPFLSFKDNKPAVVVTHGDELSLSERALIRTCLGDLLGIPPIKQIFDIPGTSEFDTELAIVDMLRYSIEHADRNLAFNQSYLLEIFVKFSTLRKAEFGFFGVIVEKLTDKSPLLSLYRTIHEIFTSYSSSFNSFEGQRIFHWIMERLHGYDVILEAVIISLCIIILFLRGIANLI